MIIWVALRKEHLHTWESEEKTCIHGLTVLDSVVYTGKENALLKINFSAKWFKSQSQNPPHSLSHTQT